MVRIWDDHGGGSPAEEVGRFFPDAVLCNLAVLGQPGGVAETGNWHRKSWKFNKPLICRSRKNSGKTLGDKPHLSLP